MYITSVTLLRSPEGNSIARSMNYLQRKRRAKSVYFLEAALKKLALLIYNFWPSRLGPMAVGSDPQFLPSTDLH